jgi:hypothetical protein
MNELIHDEISSTSITKGIKPSIITVGELLLETKITFPNYQRPYKWETRHVSQLINDIITFKENPAYRLGTVVIHLEDNGALNVVDGQQRTITLLLITKAIINKVENKKIELTNFVLKQQLKQIKDRMPVPQFINEISIHNIQRNYAEIERHVANFDESLIYFLFNKCEFVKCVLRDVSEAFQFFDAQNSRGKDLEPHDLLKAFHLREFSSKEKEYLSQTLATWEDIETQELVTLFGKYLFRIKGWIKGHSSRYFSKNEVDLFKGITIGKKDDYPYAKSLRITHFYIEKYNNSYERDIDRQVMNFPFQLDNQIINGKRFFEMIHFYNGIISNYTTDFIYTLNLNEEAGEIIFAINNYDKKDRDGDQFVRTIFDCALIFYHDKFGSVEISRFIEKAFIWAYKVRLQQQSVYLSSVDNYVLENNIFKTINNAISPLQVLQFHIPEVIDIRIGNRDSLNYNNTFKKNLIDIFKTLKYYHGE